ncbi:MAG: phosphate ABC transporter ATP-binding protein [Acidobacteriota bacterium]|nr:phosphate ABC transporter ATP-binding protein [Acidobacteriota bacterium]
MNDPREGSVPTPAHLAAEGLSYSVELNGSRRTILDDVGLRVERGSLFTVLGPSGSGKSTLLRCLNRLIEPDAGRVLLDGRPASELPVQELRRRVGMVFQTPALFDGTVLDNVLYGPRLRARGRRSSEGRAGRMPAAADERELAAALLERVGLPATLLSQPADSLSGGEAQRVSIARALANDPEALLLDEPTSALDPTAGRLIQDLLLRLAEQTDLTFVFVTHDIAQARRIGDRGLLLVDGRVMDGGPLPDFLDEPAAEATRLFVEGRLGAGAPR